LAIIGRILHLARHLERNIEVRVAEVGLGIEALDVLATLRRAGPPFQLTPSQLFRSLLLASSTMTNRIDRLEDAGLVVRKPAPNDRRSVLVGLTPEGHDLIERVFVEHLSNLRRALSGLREGERAVLVRLLRKMLLALDSFQDPRSLQRSGAGVNGGAADA
jgi:DNA-binding MarR family transcriptional regulator